MRAACVGQHHRLSLRDLNPGIYAFRPRRIDSFGASSGIIGFEKNFIKHFFEKCEPSNKKLLDILSKNASI